MDDRKQIFFVEGADDRGVVKALLRASGKNDQWFERACRIVRLPLFRFIFRYANNRFSSDIISLYRYLKVYPFSLL